MRVPEAISQPETQPEIDLIHHQKSIVPQSFGDFGHGCLSRPYTKLTCPSALLLPLPQEKQGDLASTGDEVSYTARDHRSLVNWKKHKLCLLSILLHHLLHIHNNVATERNDKPTVYSYRRQWNPCHMDFGLVFQQAIDRQDRTLQTEGRFSLLELHGDITTAWYTGILHRTRTRCKTTCLVGTPLH